MLQTDEWQQKRRLYLMCCMLIVWVVYSFNYSIAVSKMSENHKIDKVFGLIQKQPKVEVDVCQEATVKPLQSEKTHYEECELLEEEEIVTEEAEETKEVEIVENVEENIVTTNLVSAEDVATRQNVAEGDTRGTYFLERKPALEYTDDDLYYLANGIYSEAGICSDMECYRVGQVMLDRMLDQTGRFPQDTIRGILYATGQFGCVGGRAWKHGPTERELEIAKDLLEGARVFPEDIVWFNNKHDYGYLYCKPEYHYFSGYEDHGGELASKPEVTKDALTTEEVIESTENIVDEVIVAEVETTSETETVVEVEEEGVVPEEQLAVAESVVAEEPAASNQEVITEQENTSEEILIALCNTTK